MQRCSLKFQALMSKLFNLKSVHNARATDSPSPAGHCGLNEHIVQLHSNLAQYELKRRSKEMSLCHKLLSNIIATNCC